MSDGLFWPIEGSAVVLYNKGIYRQVTIFVRKNELYAKHGGGFVRLMKAGHTSYSNMSWGDISVPDDVKILVIGLGAVTLDT